MRKALLGAGVSAALFAIGICTVLNLSTPVQAVDADATRIDGMLEFHFGMSIEGFSAPVGNPLSDKQGDFTRYAPSKSTYGRCVFVKRLLLFTVPDEATHMGVFFENKLIAFMVAGSMGNLVGSRKASEMAGQRDGRR